MAFLLLVATDKARKKTLPCSPDKLTSPGVTPEEQKNDVINNTEIQRLAIKDENLAKVGNLLLGLSSVRNLCFSKIGSF